MYLNHIGHHYIVCLFHLVLTFTIMGNRVEVEIDLKFIVKQLSPRMLYEINDS